MYASTINRLGVVAIGAAMSIGAGPRPVWADQITRYATEATFIDADASSEWCSATQMIVGDEPTLDSCVGFVRFPFNTNDIPAGATIDSATAQLYIVAVNGDPETCIYGTDPWPPGCPDGFSFPGWFVPCYDLNPSISSGHYESWDVTSWVEMVVAGQIANNGFAFQVMLPDNDYFLAYTDNQSGTSMDPRLIVQFTPPPRSPDIRIEPAAIELPFCQLGGGGGGDDPSELSKVARDFAATGDTSALLTRPPADSALYYTYAGRARELDLALDRIAVLVREPAADVAAVLLAQFGAEISSVEPAAVPNWYVLTLRTPLSDETDARERMSTLLAAPVLSFATPVFQSSLVHGGWFVATPDVLVRLHPGQARDGLKILDQVAPDFDIVETDFAGMRGSYKLRAKSRHGFDVVAGANRLAADPRIEWAEPNWMGTLVHDLVPNDPGFGDLWGILNTGQTFPGVPAGVPDVDIDGELAWDITTGDSDIVVLVLDDGVQQDHPDINQLPGRNFTTGEPDGIPDGGPENTCDRHGTAVAGCVSAIINNQIGTVGVTPGCRIRSARVSISNVASPCPNNGMFMTAWLCNALAWGLEQGVRVSNASFHLDFTSSAIDASYESGWAAGMVHFAAAGNGGRDNVGDAVINYPASIPVVNAVAAIDPDGTLTSFSNYGPGLDFAAPGIAIYTTDRTGSAGYGPGDYTFFGGTSAASPYAAGVAALVLSRNPTLSAEAVEAVMAAGATDLGSAGYDTTFGHGLVNAFQSIAAAGTFVIYNDGPAMLTVNAISTQSGGCWLSISPSVPYNIPPGGYQVVYMDVNVNCTPPPGMADQILVFSNDPDENPYPNAVFVDGSVIGTIPQAEFTGMPTSGAAPLIVNFSDLSSGSVTAWKWDFENDGVVDTTEQTPSHSYVLQGSYTVKLTVSGPCGVNGETKSNYITVTDGNVAPTIDQGATITLQVPQNGSSTVTLSATDPGEPPNSLSWLASPGQHGVLSGIVGSPSSSGGLVTIDYTPTPRYNGADSFTVTVTDDQGASDAITVVITVTQQPPASIVSANPPSESPFVMGQPFRDCLQTGSTPALTQGIGVAGTPCEAGVCYAPISVTFSGTPSPAPTPANVLVACTGGICPTVTSVTGSGAGPYLLSLSAPIPPMECTMLTFAGTMAGQKLQYQYLPGDVNLSGSVSAVDVFALVSSINVGTPPPASLPANLPRYDINRSGMVTNSDVLRLVGLLNGLNTPQVWLGAVVAGCDEPPPEDGLVAHWDFEEGAGTQVIDASGNGHNSSAITNFQWTSDAAAGQYAAQYDGTACAIIPDHPDLELPGDFTVAAFVKANNGLLGTPILAKHDGNQNGSWVWGVAGADQLEPYKQYFIATPWQGELFANPAFLAPEWRHVAFRYSDLDQAYSVFLDGALVGSGEYATNIFDNAANLHLGCGDFRGLLDDVRIYNRALSEAEVAALAAPTAFSWSWDGTTDPGFAMSQGVVDTTSYYDAANQILRVGYGVRPGIPGLPEQFTTVFRKELPVALGDFQFIIEYTVETLGYFVDPGMSDNDLPIYPDLAAATLQGHVYEGGLTYVQAIDHGIFPLDELLAGGHPQEGQTYRLTLSRTGSEVVGKMEVWQDGAWILLGTVPPTVLPDLDEPFQYVRFDQSNYGTFGQLWVKYISVTGQIVE